MVTAHLEGIIERIKARLKNASGSICRISEEGPIGFDVIDPLIEIIKAQEARIASLKGNAAMRRSWASILSAISIAWCLLVLLVWLAAWRFPRCRVESYSLDTGRSITASFSTRGWDAHGLYFYGEDVELNVPRWDTALDLENDPGKKRLRDQLLANFQSGKAALLAAAPLGNKRIAWQENPPDFQKSLTPAMQGAFWSFGSYGGHYYDFARIALWLALLPAYRLLYRCWRYWQARRQTLSWACAACGYNLTGNISGVCPECGTATDPKLQ